MKLMHTKFNIFGKSVLFVVLLLIILVQAKYDPCGEDGHRTERGKYCGFGWRFLEWTGEENFWAACWWTFKQIFLFGWVGSLLSWFFRGITAFL